MFSTVSQTRLDAKSSYPFGKHRLPPTQALVTLPCLSVHAQAARCYLGLCQPVLLGILDEFCTNTALQCIEHVTVTLTWCMYFAACESNVLLQTLSPVHVQVRLFNARAAVSSMHLLVIELHKGSVVSMPYQPCGNA